MWSFSKISTFKFTFWFSNITLPEITQISTELKSNRLHNYSLWLSLEWYFVAIFAGIFPHRISFSEVEPNFLFFISHFHLQNETGFPCHTTSWLYCKQPISKLWLVFNSKLLMFILGYIPTGPMSCRLNSISSKTSCHIINCQDLSMDIIISGNQQQWQKRI